LSTGRGIPYLQATMFYFVYLNYRRTDNDVYDDFPKISDHFLKISKDSSRIFERPHKHLKTKKQKINKAQFETEEKLN